MKLQLTIECEQDEFLQCIASSWQKAYDEPLPTIQIAPFTVGAVATPTDVKNMLTGSCMGELINDNTVEMKVIG